MGKGIHRLTAKQVEHAKPGRHADGKGLWLQVARWKGKDGKFKVTRSWLFQYTSSTGKIRQMGLGSAQTVSLGEARVFADDVRRQLRDGVDPIDARREAKDRKRLASFRTVSFKQAAEEHIAAFRPIWKSEKHAAQWTSTLETYAFPLIGDVSVSEIDVDLVCKVLQPIWMEKPETASRLRGRIEAILGRAIAMKQREGDNPARWDRLEAIFPARTAVQKIRNHPALPYAEVGAFIAELRSKEGISARALEFTILTAARTSEVIGARAEEFNLTDNVWTVPAERMKTKKEHRVPLSKRALQIIRELPHEEGNPFVFIGRKGQGLSNMSLLKVMRELRPDYVVHGFRSSFRDWVGEATNHSGDVAEMALSHTIKNKVEAAYRRGDLFEKRRRMMEDWAAFCSRVPKKQADNVTLLRVRSN